MFLLQKKIDLKFSPLKLNQSLILQMVSKQIKSIGVKEFCPSSINRNCEPWPFRHLWKKVLRSISYLQCEQKMYVCVGNRDMEHVIHTQHFTTKYHHILKYVRSEHKISVPLLRIHCRPHLCPMTNYDAQGQPNVTVYLTEANRITSIKYVRVFLKSIFILKENTTGMVVAPKK